MLTLDVGSAYRYARGDVNIDIRIPLKKPSNFIRADAHNLPFRNDVFDKASFIEVIEHVESPTKVLKEIHRVLKSKGVVIVTTPNPYHWRKLFRLIRGRKIILSDREHISAWTPAEMENLLHNCGFNSIKITFMSVPYPFLWGAHPTIDKIMKKILHPVLGNTNLEAKAKK